MVRKLVTAGICILVLVIAQSAAAGTIIKLGLGGDGAFDVEYTGGTLSTVDDANATTSGDQNTDIEFSDFLSSEVDIPTSVASFSLSNMASAGDASVFGGVLVIQEFTGGTFSLYDAADTLLLSGNLTDSILAGSLGPSATGSLLTINFGDVTAGALASQILPNSLSLSIGLNAVNGGAGFSTTGAGQVVLDDFTADATLSIAAEQVPEPSSILLGALAGLMSVTVVRRIRN